MQMILPWKEANNQSYLYLLFFSVMHPVSAMRTRWDVYILLVMLALCLITPYTIGFDITPDNTSIIGMSLSHVLIQLLLFTASLLPSFEEP